MKKKNKSLNHIQLLFIGFITFFSVGCNSDFLDRPPLGYLDQDTYLNTEGAGLKLLTNCYKPMQAGNEYQQIWFEFGDQLADDMYKGGSDAGDRDYTAQVAKGDPMATNTLLNRLWNHRYPQAIAPCNILLSLINEDTPLLEIGGTFTPKEKKLRWIGEAHFLRAYYYFSLATVFGHIPIIDKPLLSNDKSSIVKSDKEEVLDFILSDLEKAISEPNIPSVSKLPADEFGRITKEAMHAFRARVYLWRGDYESAKKDLQSVVESGHYDLIDNYELLFNNAVEGYMSKESVFLTPMKYIPNYTNGSTAPQKNVGRGPTGGWGGQCPTNDLVAEFEVGDPRLVHTVISSGDIFPLLDGKDEVHDYTGYDNFSKLQCRKHYPTHDRRVSGNLQRTDWSFYQIRYADVLLLYAECLIETNDNLQKAVDIINKVRYRAFVTSPKTDSYARFRLLDLPESEWVDEAKFNSEYKVKLGSVEELRKALRHERRVELAGEGFRFFDLMRWGIYIETVQKFSKTEEGAYYGTGVNVTEKTWPYPIPQSEIDDVGGSLVQHDNY